MSAYVRWLVAQKRRWHHRSEPEEASLGFRGWHTRGYLPHFDVPGVLQMLNFRLADALPQGRRHEWESLVRINDERQRRIRLEEYCDRGYGACELAIPAVAQRMEAILLKDWKGICSHYVNRLLVRSGQWWQEEYFDRRIRDDVHFHKAVHYIENNPVKAGLVPEAKAWRWSSAKWRPEGFGLQPVQPPKA